MVDATDLKSVFVKSIGSSPIKNIMENNSNLKEKKNFVSRFHLEEHFKSKTIKELIVLLKKMGIATSTGKTKPEIIFLLVNFFEKNPLGIRQLNIDIVEQTVPMKIISEEVFTKIKVTKKGLFCLEDIFSIRIYDVDKSSSSKYWLSTDNFKRFFSDLKNLSCLNEKDLIYSDCIGTTYVHGCIAIKAAFFRSDMLGLAFSGFFFNILTETIVDKSNLSIDDIKYHPIYKNMSDLITRKEKLLLKKKKERVVNYVVKISDYVYKIYTALNFSKIETERGTLIKVIYHNSSQDVARFHLERAIHRRLKDYYVPSNRYFVSRNTIENVIKDIVETCSFDVDIENL